jgi:hypothetical protein
LPIKVKKKLFFKTKRIYKSFYKVLYNLRKKNEYDFFLKSKKKSDSLKKNKATFLKNLKVIIKININFHIDHHFYYIKNGLENGKILW